VLLQDDKIFVNDHTLKRSCLEYSERCYVDDYFALMRHFRELEYNDTLIIEDDVLLCPSTAAAILNCHRKHINCKLGSGATANYFVNFINVSTRSLRTSDAAHVDLVLRDLGLFTEVFGTVNHLNYVSTLGHKDGWIHRCKRESVILI
jgi:hypothetical protein